MLLPAPLTRAGRAEVPLGARIAGRAVVDRLVGRGAAAAEIPRGALAVGGGERRAAADASRVARRAVRLRRVAAHVAVRAVRAGSRQVVRGALGAVVARRTDVAVRRVERVRRVGAGEAVEAGGAAAHRQLQPDGVARIPRGARTAVSLLVLPRLVEVRPARAGRRNLSETRTSLRVSWHAICVRIYM